MNTGEKILAHLAGYGLKDEHNGNWRCNSPLRPGSDSHSFTLRVDAGGETGAWTDHAGGESGSLYDLADRLGIAIEYPEGERPKVADSKRAYSNLADYAALKGVPVDVFIKAGWSAEPVTYTKRQAIQFKTSTGNRYRFLDGQKPKFSSEKGYKACWYGLKIAAILAKQQNQPLVLVNGEPSVIVGMHYKIPACTITGGEKPTIPPELLTELKNVWSGQIIVALDCDEAGRKAALGKVDILTKAGFKAVAVDLGLGDKGDVADLCKLFTDNTMAHLLKLAQKPMTAEAQAKGDVTELVKELSSIRRNGDKAAETLPALLDKAGSEIEKMRRNYSTPVIRSFGEIVSMRHRRLDETRKNPNAIQGLRSGIDKLDTLIGGFLPGRVYTWYGDTGMGKSTTAGSIVGGFAAEAPGIIIPTENMPGDYLDKLVSWKANIPFDAIETGLLTTQEYNTVMAAYNWFEDRNCDFFDELNPTPSLLEMVVRDGIRDRGYQWALIDSVNNLGSTLHDDIYGKTTEAADLAQKLARLGIVVLMTAQVGRNLKDRKNKIPKLADALGSGAIERNSDVVTVLYNHDYYVKREEAEADSRFPAGMMLARCLKHRQRGNAEGKGKFLTFKGGIGVYD